MTHHVVYNMNQNKPNLSLIIMTRCIQTARARASIQKNSYEKTYSRKSQSSKQGFQK